MDTVHECDRQTDGQTDGRAGRITITKTVQRRTVKITKVAVVECRTDDLVVHRWAVYLPAKAAVGSRVLNHPVKHACRTVIECYTSLNINNQQPANQVDPVV